MFRLVRPTILAAGVLESSCLALTMEQQKKKQNVVHIEVDDTEAGYLGGGVYGSVFKAKATFDDDMEKPVDFAFKITEYDPFDNEMNVVNLLAGKEIQGVLPHFFVGFVTKRGNEIIVDAPPFEYETENGKLLDIDISGSSWVRNKKTYRPVLTKPFNEFPEEILQKCQLNKIFKRCLVIGMKYVPKDEQRDACEKVVLKSNSNMWSRAAVEHVDEFGPVYTNRHSFCPRKQGAAEIQSTFKTLLHGLSGLHDLDIFLGDMHFGNILDTKSGEIYLFDFGFSQIKNMWNNGINPPINAYAPPEPLQGKLLEPASNVWSLGLIMYTYICQFSPLPQLNTAAFGEPESPVVIYSEKLFTMANILETCIAANIDKGHLHRAADLISQMMRPLPKNRIRIADALHHDFFAKKREKSHGRKYQARKKKIQEELIQPHTSDYDTWKKKNRKIQVPVVDSSHSCSWFGC